MRALSKLDHLLAQLRLRCFTKLDDPIALRWVQAAPEQRATMVQGPHADWADVTADTVWGEPQSYFWFHGTATTPEDVAGQRLYLWIEAEFGRVMGRSDPQCLVRINDKITQGADFNHREVLLSPSAVAGETFEIMVEAGTIEDRLQRGFSVQLMTHDALAESVYFDLKVPLDVARHLPENDHRRDVILTTVYEAINAIDLRHGDLQRFHASLDVAREIAGRIYDMVDTELTPKITVTGHTHIDVAWLWRVRETRQKMARSMSTALTLMEEYDEYLFMYNQGYLLDTLQQDYPEIFERLKAQHDTGRFEIEGALWLEPDANMTSGESLVRQILKGIQYHQDTFGVTPKIVWLPDTFGYSAALPQIMAQTGLEVFVTHKMSWNDTNKMPSETFFWQGLDGTRVPTYFLTTQPMESTSIGTTYCPDLKASHVMGTWRRYAQKTTNDELILVYGHGDGGGGPTREMLEHIRRMERGIPGCPQVQHGHMGPFFDRLTTKMHATPEAYPTWVGELYLEFHRGTFTSVAEVKRNNRRGEAVMREVEAMASLALVRAGHAYPRDEINALWDIVLLNQFHDILPGSSIPEVYEDSAAEFAEFYARADQLLSDLAARLAGQDTWLLMNPMGQARDALVTVDGAAPLSIDGMPTQSLTRATGEVVQGAIVKNLPAIGAASVTIATSAAQAPAATELSVSETHIENARLRATLDGAGRLSSVVDKRTGREVLKGAGNRLQAFRDLPAQYDAWDIDTTYMDQAWEIDDLVSAEVVETGPYRAAIRLEWRYEASTIVQVLSLEAGADVIEFDTAIDWREKNTLLKSAFPLDVQTSESIAEVQFGHVARPTHQNTSWDEARFEAPMHRWVSLGEADFGAAVLNDCKYGYDAQGTTLRLTILRAPTWPWDGADIGTHHLRYGFMLHHGIEAVPAVAEAFNHPLVLRSGGDGDGADLSSLVTPKADGIAVEAVKLSEDGTALIVRLWERFGRSQQAQITLASDILSADLADMLENSQETLELAGSDVALSFKPFEIKTLRLTWKTMS